MSNAIQYNWCVVGYKVTTEADSDIEGMRFVWGATSTGDAHWRYLEVKNRGAACTVEVDLIGVFQGISAENRTDGE